MNPVSQALLTVAEWIKYLAVNFEPIATLVLALALIVGLGAFSLWMWKQMIDLVIEMIAEMLD